MHSLPQNAWFFLLRYVWFIQQAKKKLHQLFTTKLLNLHWKLFNGREIRFLESLNSRKVCSLVKLIRKGEKFLLYKLLKGKGFKGSVTLNASAMICKEFKPSAEWFWMKNFFVLCE